MKKFWLTWIGLGTACAVCCAPLLAPILAGAGLAGIGAAGAGFSFLKLSPSEVICIAAIVSVITAAIGAFALVRQRAGRRAAEACACEATDRGGHCDTGGGCAPSPRRTAS
jgi:hypothetical protein